MTEVMEISGVDVALIEVVARLIEAVNELPEEISDARVAVGALLSLVAFPPRLVTNHPPEHYAEQA